MTVQDPSSSSPSQANQQSVTPPNPATAWQLLDSRTVAESPRATVHANTYRLPDGSTRADYLVVDERSGTLVVAVTEGGEVLLVGQHRAPVGAFLWELPAGALEPGETDPEERARAELREETGYEAATWVSLGTFHAAPHRSTETDYCYLALGARKVGEQRLDQGESVSFRLVALAELERMLDNHEIVSGPALVTLGRALALLRQREPVPTDDSALHNARRAEDRAFRRDG